jgi:hypothetical protein
MEFPSKGVAKHGIPKYAHISAVVPQRQGGAASARRRLAVRTFRDHRVK